MSDPTRALLRWLSAHDPVERVVLACDDADLPKVPRRSLVVGLAGCVKDTGIGLPAQLLAAGVGAVDVAPCPSFPQEAAAQLARWRTVLVDGVHPLDPPRRGRSRAEVLTLGEVPLPRRLVLGLGMRDDFPLDLELDDAARTLAALRLLEEAGRATPRPAAHAPDTTPDEAAEEPAGPAGAAAALSVSGCVACGVCVKACPHDALVLAHDGDTSTLTHLREACRAELDCVRLCPVDAISTGGRVPLADLLEEPVRTLSTVRTAACERCGARHPAEDGPLCPPCKFREGNVFGSTLPPALLAKLAAARREQGGA